MFGYIYNTYKQSLSGLSREVWIISALMLVNRAGLMVVPFLSIYLTQELQLTIIQAGIAGMWFGIGSLISSLLGGWLTDKYGYNYIMRASLLLGGLAFWSLIFAKTFILFCSMVFLTALLADMVRPAIMSSISVYSKEGNRTRAISLLRMAINLGIAIGPALGGFMASNFGYNWLFILNGGSSIITFMAFSYLYKTMKKQPKSEELKMTSVTAKSAYTDFNYWLMLGSLFIILIAFLQLLFGVPLLLKNIYNFSEFGIGLFFTLNGLLIVIFEMPLVNYFEKRRSFYKPIMIGGTLMFFGMLSLLIPTESSVYMWIVPFLMYSLFMGFGEILNLPFYNSLSLSRATENNSGSYMGLFAFNFSLAFTIAPLVGSNIISKFGYNELWIICSLLILISLVVFSVFKKRFFVNELYN